MKKKEEKKEKREQRIIPVVGTTRKPKHGVSSNYFLFFRVKRNIPNEKWREKTFENRVKKNW